MSTFQLNNIPGVFNFVIKQLYPLYSSFLTREEGLNYVLNVPFWLVIIAVKLNDDQATNIVR